MGLITTRGKGFLVVMKQVHYAVARHKHPERVLVRNTQVPVERLSLSSGQMSQCYTQPTGPSLAVYSRRMDMKWSRTGGRAVCVCVNLDNISHNIKVLRNQCPSHKTGVIAVVKAGAYGHGSVGMSRHLKHIGVERLAVATVQEGIHLRNQAITGPIHIFGNVQSWEMRDCLLHGLIPTVCDTEAIDGMSTALSLANQNDTNISHYLMDSSDVPRGSVNLKIDTGMSRNGCQPDKLPTLVQKCQESGIHIDAMFTHFADSWGNKDFTQQQLDTFLQATDPFSKSLGIKRHVANSAAILRGYGTNLDFIRPGISMYGLPPDDASPEFQAFGLKPAGSMVGYPTLVKRLDKGRKVGYSCTHTTQQGECVATIPVGYADGYWRHLSDKGQVIRDKTGERCAVIGRVSMDAITVRVPPDTSLTESFTLISADYDPHTSASGIAAMVGTISYEVGTRLSTRLPRVYRRGGELVPITSLVPGNY